MERKYSGRNILEVRREILDYFQDRGIDTSQFTESDVSMVMIDTIAGLVDMLNFYMDQQALETYLMSASQPENIKGILETINYKLPLVVPAKAKLQLVFKNRLDDGEDLEGKNFIIPRGTLVGSDYISDVVYTIVDDVEFTEDIVEREALAVEGTFSTLSFTKDSIDSFRLYLGVGRVPSEYFELLVDGSIWEQVEDAYLEMDGGSKYSLHEDKKGQTYILFTYDYNARMPMGNIEVSYLQTRGREGIVGKNVLNKLTSDVMFYYNGDSDIDISSMIEVIMPSDSYGASDYIDLNLAKANARNYVKTLDRAVTLQDYDAFIKKEPYVIKAVTLDWMADSELVPMAYHVISWIVTRDLMSYDQSQFDESAKKIQAQGVISNRVIIQSAEFVEFDIGIEVKMNRAYIKGSFASDIEALIRDAYSLEKANFGEVVNESRIESLIYNRYPNIRELKVSMNEAFLNKVQFPIISSVSVKVDAYE